jgi:hypothetical protein
MHPDRDFFHCQFSFFEQTDDASNFVSSKSPTLRVSHSFTRN